MTRRLPSIALIMLVLHSFTVAALALNSHEVLVVYNGSTVLPLPDDWDYQPNFNLASEVVARYYAAARQIPICNILGIETNYAESITEVRYRDTIAAPIWNKLSQPEFSHIKAIVLCYGIPSQIAPPPPPAPPRVPCSVDAALALLGNTGVPEVKHWFLIGGNSYRGRYMDFASFRPSPDNVFTYEGTSWHLNYLVCRLDAFDLPKTTVDGVEIPSDIKAMIDKSISATAGGKFVLDHGATHSSGSPPDIVANLLAAGVSESDIIDDRTDAFIMEQSDVMGYVGQHIAYGYAAHNYTTWGRPYNAWRDGGVAMYCTNDGWSFRKPCHIWGELNLLDPAAVDPYSADPTNDPLNPSRARESGKLKIVNMHRSLVATDKYAGHRIVFRSTSGEVLAAGNFDHGVCTIDLSLVNWPVDHLTYFEFRFSVDDPQWPDGFIYYGKTPYSRSPGVGDETIYNSRNTGVVYDCRYRLPRESETPDVGTPYGAFKKANCLGRQQSSEYIKEGASGTIAAVAEPGGADYVQITLPTYASGYTWAESAYMGMRNLACEDVVLGDPLMAPFATPPTVTLNHPAAGATVSGTFLATAEAQSAPDPATGIANVEFWLTKTDGTVDKLVGTASEASFVCGVDSTVVPDGDYLLCAVAYENNGPRENAETRRAITVSNAGNPTTVAITLPQENAELSDSVTVEASVSNQSIVTHVEFWLVGSTCSQLVATDTTYPFSCNLDTTVCGDGAYTIHAIAYWTASGASGISGSPARSVTVNNSGIVSITSPSTDGQLVSGQIAVDVTVDVFGQPPVSHVDIHLSGNGLEDTVVGADTTAPYSISVDTTTLPDSTPIADGIYSLRAVAYKDGEQQIVNTDARTIIISNDHTVCSRIPDARTCSNGTGVTLEEKVVSAGTSPAMDSAFYIAEADRSSGLRIAWSGSEIQSGKTVTVLGEIGNNPTTGEREVAAETVWISGDASPIKPLAMPNVWVGGASPAGENNTSGITDGVGIYNIGCLVRVFGTVNYVGEDFAYIDDGGSLADGNALEGPIIVPLDGGSIPSTHPPVTGLRIYFGSLQKPGIGDYIAVNGISSIRTIGANAVRCVRARSGGAVTYVRRYERCAKLPDTQTVDPFDGYFVDMSLTPLPPGSMVRMVNAQVHSLFANYLRAYHFEPGVSPSGLGLLTYIYAQTQLSLYDPITITGVSSLIGDDHCIEPDCIYFGGYTYGAMSCSLSSDQDTELVDYGGGPFRPWPYPTAEETLASDWFKEHYSQVGAIGWAISQPDGSIIDLPGEQVILASADGKTIGLKEPFEPAQNAPKLLLLLENPVERLRQWCTIDIVGGTMTTLPNGQRAIVQPQAVYAYMDAIGRYVATWSKVSYRQDASPVLNGLWRVQIAP